jgi:hypothetical protein
LRQAGQQLADNDEGTLAHYTDSLAGQLDQFSNSLREREIGSLIDDAKQLAHRQPELFVIGALAAGFVLGRFFKSSSSARSNQIGYDYQFGYNEYDPRDSSRSYGEPYGQSYGNQFSQSRGPDYSRDYDAGYRSGYRQEYDSRSQYGQSGQGSNDQWSRNTSGQQGQGSSGQSGQNYGQSTGQNYGQSSSQGYSQGSGNQGSSSQGSGSQGPNQRSDQSGGQVTTHGLGTGQSIDRERDLRQGQEFGQGEEQVSNYKGNESKPASATQGPNKRDEEVR